MQIQFLGAADCVTGSRHLVEAGGQRVLLDCGLFQGYKQLRVRNWSELGAAPASIDAVVLSHAHLDHSGWLPVLVRTGFTGPIYCSAATADLARVLLLDAAHLQEEDARRANRGGWSRHEPAQPLFTLNDATRTLAHLHPIRTADPMTIGDALQIELTPVGHLLGACSASLRTGSGSLLFSGDVGRDDDLLMPAPLPPHPGSDVLLIESTYGNRLHVREDTQQRLGDIIRQTIHRGGKVLLPTFAVGRAQMLMLMLQRLRAAGEIPADLPIYLDSPMAQEATRIHLHHGRLLRLDAAELSRLCDGVTAVVSPKESEALIRRRWPAVILSSSGMATGGRVLFHLAALAPDPRHHIVFPGFQVAGSRGARLVGGAREVKIHGRYVAVKAQVSHLEGLSGHADRQGLLDWMGRLPGAPRQVFVVHGEPEAADALRIAIEERFGWATRVPQHGERFSLEGLKRP